MGSKVPAAAAMSVLWTYKSRTDSLLVRMRSPRRLAAVWSLLGLRRTRALLSSLRYRVLVGAIGLGYALTAMLIGGMLLVPGTPARMGWFFYVYPSGPGPSWTYPLILAGNPYFLVYLPALSGIVMTLTAAGIGLGMSLGVWLGIRLIRFHRRGLLRPTAVGFAAGLTPAMIGLVTLGACCSTTAAATAGISLVAQSSGTNPAVALANAWYLGVFQVVVVYIALLAQEKLLSVYAFLVGDSLSEPSAGSANHPIRGPLGWREAGSAVLRVVLVAAGITWCLSVMMAWTSTPPSRAGVVTWLSWVFQHEVPGILAVVVALFPTEALAWWTDRARRWPALALRTTLVISGLALLTWIPAPWSGEGAAALGNELLGLGHFPLSWGAVTPPSIGILALSLRWGFQLTLLGAFAVVMGLRPRSAVEPLLQSSGDRPPARIPIAVPNASPPLSESG